MNDKEILEKAAEQKEMADFILKESEIISMLSEYGKTKVVGSYSYDLMTAPDIDIHVIVPKLSRGLVMSVFNKLIEQNYFYAYNIADFYDKAKRPGIDRGYLIGLRYWTPDAKWDSRWKFDIWFLEKENPYNKTVVDLINDKITPEKRLDILRLKIWRDKYNTGIEAYNIYHAVLSQGINKPDDLIQYIEDTKQKH